MVEPIFSYRGLPCGARRQDLKPGIFYGIQTPDCRKQGIALGRKDVREPPAGRTVGKIFPEDTLPGGPVRRTLDYRTPFVRPDRERDYRVARAFFEREHGAKPSPSAP